MPDLVVTTELF